MFKNGGSKMPEHPILEMLNINKFFPGVKALNHVNFSVNRGEIHGLIGENGAGKSTLMNVLMGIYKLDEGSVRFDGGSVRIHNPSEAIRIGIGMVPQELNLNPFMSAAENIFLGNEIKNRFGGINWRETNIRADAALKKIGIDIDSKTIVSKLSVAQQQLVQITRVLATGARLLVLDEPTASLSKGETDFLLQVIRKLKEEEKSVIFITHHLEELFACANRVTIMRDGAIVYVGGTKDITIDQMIEHMAGQKIVRQKSVDRVLGEEVFLKVDNFTRKYEFDNISFDVKRGEIFGIGGLIGSGRTELLNAITGNTRKDKGNLYFEGEVVDVKSPYHAIRLGISYVPEERRTHGIFSILSVYENMLLPIYDRLFEHGVLQYKQIRAIADNYVRKLNIRTPSVNTPIRSLSGGNQQKVILARWLAKQTKLLILDEPTRGIDVNAKSEIYAVIRALSEQGLTVILVSSEHEELLLLADRVMVMYEGKVKKIKKASELKQQDILEVSLK
jgi:ABC-type sugar transport system ATPase subunit